jgi:mRNA interferase YafQ
MPTKYKIAYTGRYKKQRKLFVSRGYDISLLDNVVAMLANGEKLPENYRDHALRGERAGFRDCHILPDWILIYKIDSDVLTLLLSETGSHADLF